MFRIIGIDDSINVCDCCGKSNLKSTVVVDINGTLHNYGSVCATRHTGLNAQEIKKAIKRESDGRLEAALKEYDKSMQRAALYNKQSQAREKGLVGVSFKNYCDLEIKAARLLADTLSEKFGVKLHI